jgi:hypothetical protein
VPVEEVYRAAGVPNHSALVGELLGIQNGLWGPYLKKTDASGWTPYAAAEAVIGLLHFVDTPKVEESVKIALGRLLTLQKADGGWWDDVKMSLSDTTGAVLVAFLVAEQKGFRTYLEECAKNDGKDYDRIVRNATEFLLRCRNNDGGFWAAPIEGEVPSKIQFTYWSVWALELVGSRFPQLAEKVKLAVAEAAVWCESEAHKLAEKVAPEHYMGLEVRSGRLAPIGSIYGILLLWRCGNAQSAAVGLMRDHLVQAFDEKKEDWEEWSDQTIEGLAAPRKYNFQIIDWAPMALGVAGVSYLTPIFASVLRRLSEVAKERQYTYTYGHALESIAYLRGEFMPILLQDVFEKRKEQMSEIEGLRKKLNDNVLHREFKLVCTFSLLLISTLLLSIVLIAFSAPREIAIVMISGVATIEMIFFLVALRGIEGGARRAFEDLLPIVLSGIFLAILVAVLLHMAGLL